MRVEGMRDAPCAAILQSRVDQSDAPVNSQTVQALACQSVGITGFSPPAANSNAGHLIQDFLILQIRRDSLQDGFGIQRILQEER